MMYVHILGGSIALIAGASALYALKGNKLHRISGRVFVAAMLLMSASAIPLAVLAHKLTSLMGGILVIYLVLTSLITIRRTPHRTDWINIASLLAALSISVAFFRFGFQGLNSVDGTINGLPPQPMFVFGSAALLAGLGDLRMILAREISRPYRIARHLWRMCFALLMAAVSFFFGQAQVIPELLRHTPLLAIPPLTVVVLMIYWMIRVRWGKRFRGESKTALSQS